MVLHVRWSAVIPIVFNTYRAHVLGAAEGAVQADAVLFRGHLSGGLHERVYNSAEHTHPLSASTPTLT